MVRGGGLLESDVCYIFGNCFSKCSIVNLSNLNNHTEYEAVRNGSTAVCRLIRHFHNYCYMHNTFLFYVFSKNEQDNDSSVHVEIFVLFSTG